MKVLNKNEKTTYNAVISSVEWKHIPAPVKKNPFPEEDDEKW